MLHFSSLGNMLLLAFGFGFVIFWHELGHFLAAKWADVKVEQFAVGFGQALLSWRKGLGFTWGSSQEAYQNRLRAHIESNATQVEFKEKLTPTEAELSAAAAALNISETEYRLNWIPLGGYVKMLGQDDLKPGQVVSDPRSYNNKTIGQRMVIVSAGVIMNVILAAIGFVYIYTVGIEVIQPVAGLVVPGSPAQSTYKIVNNTKVPSPLRVGDRILALNGKDLSDFDKIRLYTMLTVAGDTVPLDVKHPDGSNDHLFVTPERGASGSDFPAIGMGNTRALKGPPVDVKIPDSTGGELPDMSVVKPGDVITAVDGQTVTPDQYYVLDQHLQAAAGKPIMVTITDAKGTSRTVPFNPHFNERFGDQTISFAGMQMLSRVDAIEDDSPLFGKIQPGDVIINLADPGASGGQWAYPSRDKLIDEINAAGEHKEALTLTVLRHGTTVQVSGVPSIKNRAGKWEFGLLYAVADDQPIVADDITKDSPAQLAGVRAGSTIVSLNGHPVHNWFDVKNILGQLKPGDDVKMLASFDKTPANYTLRGLTSGEIDAINQNSLWSYSTLGLATDEFPLKADTMWGSVKMGLRETRDAISQVYLTVRSMTRRGGVPVKEISGPVGILTAGYLVAARGFVHLIWFLSIISANLAVMNFLPIPIVDGGLFTFLIIEKIKGSPLSQRTQAIAQVVGLALLLSVFVFATFQDVSRLPLLFGKN
jgi:regulator of sigma E protease